MSVGLVIGSLVTSAALRSNHPLMKQALVSERNNIIDNCKQREEMAFCNSLREQLSPIFTELDSICDMKKGKRKQIIRDSLAEKCLEKLMFPLMKKTKKAYHKEAKKALHCYMSRSPRNKKFPRTKNL